MTTLSPSYESNSPSIEDVVVKVTAGGRDFVAAARVIAEATSLTPAHSIPE